MLKLPLTKHRHQIKVQRFLHSKLCPRKDKPRRGEARRPWPCSGCLLLRFFTNTHQRRAQKWVCHVNIACPSKHGKCKYVTRNALPDVTTTMMMVVVVGVAATILANQTKSSESKKKICEACSGSGICGECNGEGFILKRRSKEATDKARKNAKDAATRYTAGLPKKWNYCSKCSGSRSCLVCDGRGMIQ